MPKEELYRTKVVGEFGPESMEGPAMRLTVEEFAVKRSDCFNLEKSLITSLGDRLKQAEGKK